MSQSLQDPSLTEADRAALLAEADRAEADGRLMDAITALRAANRLEREVRQLVAGGMGGMQCVQRSSTASRPCRPPARARSNTRPRR